MKNILVTIDYNKDENLILNYSVEFAKAFNAKIWLLHIAAPEPDFVGYSVGPQYIRDCRAKEIREDFRLSKQYVKKLQEENINTEGLVISGATINTIIEESEKLNIDLIITGHHEHGFLYNLFNERVSEKIITKSKVPVLVIPL